MGSFVFVIHGTDGDVLPFVRIAGALGSRGCDVTVLTHARYSSRVRTAGARFVAVDTISADQRDLARGERTIAAVEQSDWASLRDYYEASGFFSQFLFECRAMQRRARPGCLLVGSAVSNLSVLTAAELLDLPAICLASAPYALAALAQTAQGYSHIFGDGLSKARVELGLRPVTDWESWLWSATHYVGLWPDWYDEAGPRAPAGTKLTGFVLADEDGGDEIPATAAALLDGPQPPLLAVGSTSRMVHRQFYDTAVQACALLDRPTLVVAPYRDLAPDHLPARVHWVPRLPLRSVMPKVAAVIHHGGIGTLGRALAAGVPQVLLPYGFDRLDNAERLAQRGLAGWLPVAQWNPAALAALVGSALSGGAATPGAPPVGDAVATAAVTLQALADAGG